MSTCSAGDLLAPAKCHLPCPATCPARLGQQKPDRAPTALQCRSPLPALGHMMGSLSEPPSPKQGRLQPMSWLMASPGLWT